jgi:hypothetical protein
MFLFLHNDGFQLSRNVGLNIVMHLGKTSQTKRDVDGKTYYNILTYTYGDNEDLRSFTFY